LFIYLALPPPSEFSHPLSSSIHFARDFLTTDHIDDDDLPRPAPPSPRSRPPASPSTAESTSGTTGMEGLQVLTRLIDKILSRVRVIASGTIIRLQHSTKPITSDYQNRRDNLDCYLDMSIPLLSFNDETPGVEDGSTSTTDSSETGTQSNSWLPGGDIIKSIKFSGVNISLSDDHQSFGKLSDFISKPSPSLGTFSNSTETKEEDSSEKAKLILASSDEQESWIRLKIRPLNDSMSSSFYQDSPNSTGLNTIGVNNNNNNYVYDIDCFVKSLCAILTPKDFHLVNEILTSLAEGFHVRDKVRSIKSPSMETPSPLHRGNINMETSQFSSSSSFHTAFTGSTYQGSTSMTQSHHHHFSNRRYSSEGEGSDYEEGFGMNRLRNDGLGIEGILSDLAVNDANRWQTRRYRGQQSDYGKE